MVLETKYGKIIKARPETSGTTVFCRLPYTKKPSPIEPKSRPQTRDDVSNAVLMRPTVNLSGRAMRPDQRRAMPSDQRRERTLSSGARGAQPQTHHGPLQRLSGGIDCFRLQPTTQRSPKNYERCERTEKYNVIPNWKFS
jgi:hypothetical protein